jgi:Brp/Blh family beta-carotene 15,15'-monooxygenase
MIGATRQLASHRVLFTAVVPVLLAVLLFVQPPVLWQIIALGPLVVVLGLPHGALDHTVAGALWPLATLRQHVTFILGYTGLAGAVLIFWIWQPASALAAFLIYSALHFSDDWRDDLGLWQSLPLGVCVVALPALAFQPDVALLFSFLTSAQLAQMLAQTLHVAAIVALGAATVCLGLNVRRAPGIVVEFAVLVATALIAPPLVFFILYFCGLHSPRHFLHTAQKLHLTAAQALHATLPILCATLAGGGIAACILASLGTSFSNAAMVFAGLAAVTVPHMLLTSMFRQAHH